MSLRVDDWVDRDISYMSPALENRGLVAGFAIPSDRLPSPSYPSASDALSLQNAGHEIMCHSKTHGIDPVNESELETEILESLNSLRAAGLKIDSFVQPGTWIDFYDIDGESFGGTGVDLMLRCNYACYEAYIFTFWDSDSNKRNLPIPTRNRYGIPHVTGDSMTLLDLQTLIDEVAAGGQGTEILFHSGRVGSPTYISEADFESFLDYVAAAVSGGDIIVMTPTQQLFAQPA